MKRLSQLDSIEMDGPLHFSLLKWIYLVEFVRRPVKVTKAINDVRLAFSFCIQQSQHSF